MSNELESDSAMGMNLESFGGGKKNSGMAGVRVP